MLTEYFIWPYILPFLADEIVLELPYFTRRFYYPFPYICPYPLKHSISSKHMNAHAHPEVGRWSVIFNSKILFQIRMLITMATDDTSEKHMKDSYLFFRFASWALVVDPWIYVLLRREIIMNVCIFFQRQQRPLLTSSGDAVERKSNDERKSLANDEKGASYGTI